MRKGLKIILAPCFLLFLSCSRFNKEDIVINLPPTPILTATSSWGIVNVPYLKIQANHENTSEVYSLLRKGDLVEILSKAGTGNGLTYWLEVQFSDTRGWVPELSVDVYNSRSQARTALEAMPDVENPPQ